MCFIIFVCRAEGDESRLLSSLFAERNVMNHILYYLYLRSGT